jgi:glycosyltransferase involved in cell wall biosynthesis
MGYLDTLLPKYLARLGVDAHVVTMDLPPYYRMASHDEVFGNFQPSAELYPGATYTVDGYTVHVLGHKKIMGHMRMIDMQKELRLLRPDIVQTTTAIGWLPLDAMIGKMEIGYKLFTGNHNAASTFSLARQHGSMLNGEMVQCILTRYVPGRIVSFLTEKCYGVTKDCAEIAWRFYGVQRRKVEVMHLGVDTDFFYQCDDGVTSAIRDRRELRCRLGFKDDEIVCIYTGKLTEEKNALILGRAIEKLRGLGKPYRGLFVGEGVQKESIQAFPSCVVLGFMNYRKLAPYYRASDIAVWPTNESISMLDAAACGLPLIVSDGIVYRDHVEGNGCVYRMNDLDDLVRALGGLEPLEKRRLLGDPGAKKMREQFSMESVAKRRLNDYEVALSSRPNHGRKRVQLYSREV